MNLTNSPSSIMNIQYGAHRPGLGHQLTSLCYLLLYCQIHNIYPVINDNPKNAYGKWTDYFKPFWDETLKEKLLLQFNDIPVIEKDLISWASSRSGLFGESWKELTEDIKDIFLDIFIINKPSNTMIAEKIQELNLPNQYSSVHIRRGDKNDQFKEYGQQSDIQIIRELEKSLIDKSIANVFLMTDDYHIVDIMRSRTSFQIYTLCSPSTDGNSDRLRTSRGHTVDLLTDITVAKNSGSHFQTVNTRVSKIVRLLRKDENCFHIFDENYTVDTSL